MPQYILATTMFITSGFSRLCLEMSGTLQWASMRWSCPMDGPNGFADVAQASFQLFLPAAMVLTLIQRRNFKLNFGSPASEFFMSALTWSEGTEQSNLIEWMAPSAAELARTASGSRLVQEALNLTKLQEGFRQSSDLEAARRELLHNLLSSGTVALGLSRCKHGNHVLQCLANNATANEIVRLVEVLREEVLAHARHKFGQRIITALVENFTDPVIEPLLDTMVAHAHELATHKHGNWCVSGIIRHGQAHRRQQIFDSLLPNVIDLCMHPAAIHVCRSMLFGDEFRGGWTPHSSPLLSRQKLRSAFLDVLLESDVTVADVASNRWGSALIEEFVECCSSEHLRRIQARLPALVTELRACEPSL